MCFYKSRELPIDQKRTVSGNVQCSGIRACLGLQIKFVGIAGCGCWAPWRMKPVPTITTLHVHPSFDLLSLPMLATQRRHFSILCQQTILLFQVGCERHQYKSMQCSSQPCTFLLYYGTVHEFFFLFDVKYLKREGMPKYFSTNGTISWKCSPCSESLCLSNCTGI